MKLGYIPGPLGNGNSNQMKTHGLLMDDLKVYSTSDQQLEKVIQLAAYVMENTGLNLGLDKCSVLTIKAGKECTTKIVKITDEKIIEGLKEGKFCEYLGMSQRADCEDKVIGNPMGTNCAPLLADLFLYSYESEFLDNMIRDGHRKLARSFNVCYRYIDDLIVFNNKKFGDYAKEIYSSQLTVEKANTSDYLANYLDLIFIIESNNRLYTTLYDKRDDFDFHIVNFPFLSSNIPSSPSYGVHISQ